MSEPTRIHTKVVIDMWSGVVLRDESFLYLGPMALCQDAVADASEGEPTAAEFDEMLGEEAPIEEAPAEEPTPEAVEEPPVEEPEGEAPAETPTEAPAEEAPTEAAEAAEAEAEEVPAEEPKEELKGEEGAEAEAPTKDEEAEFELDEDTLEMLREFLPPEEVPGAPQPQAQAPSAEPTQPPVETPAPSPAPTPAPQQRAAEPQDLILPRGSDGAIQLFDDASFEAAMQSPVAFNQAISRMYYSVMVESWQRFGATVDQRIARQNFMQRKADEVYDKYPQLKKAKRDVMRVAMNLEKLHPDWDTDTLYEKTAQYVLKLGKALQQAGGVGRKRKPAFAPKAKARRPAAKAQLTDEERQMQEMLDMEE